MESEGLNRFQFPTFFLGNLPDSLAKSLVEDEGLMRTLHVDSCNTVPNFALTKGKEDW